MSKLLVRVERNSLVYLTDTFLRIFIQRTFSEMSEVTLIPTLERLLPRHKQSLSLDGSSKLPLEFFKFQFYQFLTLKSTLNVRKGIFSISKMKLVLNLCRYYSKSEQEFERKTLLPSFLVTFDYIQMYLIRMYFHGPSISPKNFFLSLVYIYTSNIDSLDKNGSSI